jgi:glucokinase
MTKVVAVDVGGTHARFALADVKDGQVRALAAETTLKTSEYVSFQTAWEEFGAQAGGTLPDAVSIAIAGPVQGDIIQFTNNPWVIRPALINQTLGVKRHLLINDFAAVGYAVAQAPPEFFLHLAGPDEDLPSVGTISVVGPGTGLGVAYVRKDASGYQVQATEGGHSDYAPTDLIEDAILAHLRRRHRRVSVERVVAGPGLAEIYSTLAKIEDRAIRQISDTELWSLAMSGSDGLAAAALDRFCLALGSVAGDLALAQGASATVIAGGLGHRIRDQLLRSGFADRYAAKGRFEGMMRGLPVKLIIHPQPGLLGAAAAFAQLSR